LFVPSSCRDRRGGGSMWGWLPNVYYDFLARIVPGAAVVLGAVYLREGPYRGIGFVMRVVCEPEPWVPRFAVGLLAAYFIGLIIGELGELVAGRLLEHRDLEKGLAVARECLDEHNRTAEISGGRPLEVLPEELPTIGLMAEEIAVADPHTGGRLLALSAERRMCLVLALGLFLLAMFNVLLYTVDFVPKRLFVEALLVVSILVLWRRSTRLHLRSVRQTCQAWLMGTPGEPAEQ